MAEKKGMSPWMWAGCGCAAAVFAGGLTIALLLIRAADTAREFAEEMRDPQSREQRVLETLGAESLPEGYFPVMGLSLPFIMDIAILSDTPLDATDAQGDPPRFDERGFLYLKMLSLGRQQDELRAFFEGEETDPEVLRRNRINIDVREVIDRGEIDRTGVDEAQMLWAAHRGGIDVMGASGEGITTLVLMDCGDRRRLRLGVWFSVAPEDADAEGGATALVGTPADPQAIARFVEPLRPCA